MDFANGRQPALEGRRRTVLCLVGNEGGNCFSRCRESAASFDAAPSVKRFEIAPVSFKSTGSIGSFEAEERRTPGLKVLRGFRINQSGAAQYVPKVVLFGP